MLDGTPHTIRIRSGEAQSMTLYNSLKGSLTIRKIDSATGNALAGAQFQITTATGDAVTSYTDTSGSNGSFITDRNGEITLNRLQPGTYTIREVQAPDGYVMDDQPRTVVLDAAGTQTVTFTNVSAWHSQKNFGKKFWKGLDRKYKMIYNETAEPICWRADISMPAN